MLRSHSRVSGAAAETFYRIFYRIDEDEPGSADTDGAVEVA